MIQFLLTQIAKIKGNINTIDGKVSALIKSGGVPNGDEQEILSATEGAHVLALSRQTGERAVVVMTDYWSATYFVVAGTVPEGITITKEANTHSITVSNATGSAIAYMYI